MSLYYIRSMVLKKIFLPGFLENFTFSFIHVFMPSGFQTISIKLNFWQMFSNYNFYWFILIYVMLKVNIYLLNFFQDSRLLTWTPEYTSFNTSMMSSADFVFLLQKSLMIYLGNPCVLLWSHFMNLMENI